MLADEVIDAVDEDVDNVSVGGMDVSDIEDEETGGPPVTARGPLHRRPGGNQGPPRPGGPEPGQTPSHQPAPPRFAPRPPGTGSQAYAQTVVNEQ